MSCSIIFTPPFHVFTSVKHSEMYSSATVFLVLSNSFCSLHSMNSSLSVRNLRGYSSAFITLSTSAVPFLAPSMSSQEASDVFHPLSETSPPSHINKLIQPLFSSSLSMQQVALRKLIPWSSASAATGQLPSTLGHWSCRLSVCASAQKILVSSVSCRKGTCGCFG
jgi:hypothetical protein